MQADALTTEPSTSIACAVDFQFNCRAFASVTTVEVVETGRTL